MASPHTLQRYWREAPWRINDLGDGVKVPHSKVGLYEMTVAAATAETATLPRPSRRGLLLLLVATSVGGGGQRTITVTGGYNVAGNTSLVFATQGGWAMLWSVEINGSFQWVLIQHEGVTGPTIDVGAIDVDTVTVDTAVNLADDVYALFGTGSDVKLQWNGTYLEAGPASGFWAGAPSPADPQYHVHAHEFFDDFQVAPLDANLKWHEEDDGGTGTNAITDAANGVGTVVTAAADNDYHAISSLAEIFKFATGKKLWFEARFKLAEAATNESAWWFGLTDTLTTGGLQADAAGPLASYDGFLIWKDEGTLKVDSELSEAGDQDTDAEEADFVSNKWSRVGFYFDGVDTITPYYDMNEAGAWTAGTDKKFAGNLALADMDEMHVVAGVKAGPSGNAETLQIDYIQVVQLR